MRQTSTLALTLCLLPLLPSASSGDTVVKAPLNKQTYSIPTVGIEDLDTLDPALAYDPNSTNAIQMIYTGPVGLNDTLQVTPQTAASWQVNAKETTRTFHLCPHLQFEEALVQGTFLVEILEN